MSGVSNLLSDMFYFILFYSILFYFVLLEGTLVTVLIFASSNLRINLFQYSCLGPTTAAAMASSKKWKQLVLPALLTGMIYIILPHPTLLNSPLLCTILYFSMLFYAIHFISS